MHLGVLVGAALVVACSGCASPSGSGVTASSPPPSAAVSESASPSTLPGPSATPNPTPTPTPTPTSEAQFRSAIDRIDAGLAKRMTSSWRAGCPVALRDLRYVTVTYVGFDGHSRTGELVVHRAVASDVVQVFRELHAAGFPIRSMRLVDDFGGDDDASMAADNTSAFNCRPSTGSPGEWSQHSYGRAIDINPRENPYVSGGTAYVDRTRPGRGLVRANGPVVEAFAAIDWTWGGTYRSVKDYQHFSANGR